MTITAKIEIVRRHSVEAQVRNHQQLAARDVANIRRLTVELPDGKAGLASGTLTMARNVGTALGVALLGTVFAHHVEGDLPARLADRPAGEVATVVAAAAHFVPSGSEAARAAAQTAIVGGFVEMALVGALLCGGATVATVCRRVPQDDPPASTGPQPESSKPG